jgi:hypothetical protein
VNFPSSYTIVVTALDRLGNSTEITRELLIVNDPTAPVAVVANPIPGYRNGVFSPGSFTWVQDGAPKINEKDGVILSTTYTYLLDQVSRGQGYNPRNASDQRVNYSFFSRSGSYEGIVNLNGTTIVNGRITGIPESAEVEFPGSSGGFGPSGLGVVDNQLDPGQDSRLDVVVDLFRADAALESFKIFINGEDVTPGNGNLNSDAGPISVPLLRYPSEGSLAPGQYVVTAEVTDQDGEVGISRSLVFTIDPFEELEVNLTSDAGDEVNQGDTITYLVEVTPNDSLDTVEIFDSSTNDSLGFASRVTINAEVFYRFTRTYDEAGNFSIFARATTFSEQQVASNQVSVDVLPFNDAVVTITSPEEDADLILGSSLTFSAEASASPGISSITWFVNNNPIETVESSTASFVFVSGIQDGQFPLGTYTVTASTIDNFGNQVGSIESIVVSVVASDISVRITSPSDNRVVIEGERLTFIATASSSVGVASVEWFVGQTLLETDNDTPYSFTNDFTSSGEFSVRAEAIDTLGNRSASSAITVTVNPPNALLRNRDFVTSMYNLLLGRVPNSQEIATALDDLNDSLDSRVNLVAKILGSDSASSATTVPIIYRTMTGEWPNPEETEQALNDFFGEGTRTETRDGTIFLFSRQSFNIDVPAGSRVTATVRSADESGLVDPILQVFSPFGGFVAFDDDSGPGLFPQITFSAFEGGAYTFTVDGFSSSIGNFILEVEIFGEGGEVGNPSALTLALLPEYEARFGVRGEALPFVRQLFRNKHGSNPSALSEVRLLATATGESIEYGTQTIPGYSGNLDVYAAEFALDNENSPFIGPSRLPMSAVHLYEKPNNPADKAGIALLVSALLGEDPTDSIVNSFASYPLNQAILQILTDSRYYSQFPTNSIEGQVAQYMAGFGIFDLSRNGLADDPDGDGASNEAEFNADTDPTDPSDLPAVPIPSSASMVLGMMQTMGELVLTGMDDDADGDGVNNLTEIALGGDPVDSSLGIQLDQRMEPSTSGGGTLIRSSQNTSESKTFVLTYLRLKAGERPADMSIDVEVSTDLVSWQTADPTSSTTVMAADQSGVPERHERVEFRATFDPVLNTSMFVRVAIDTE